jgi:hypothetical protein
MPLTEERRAEIRADLVANQNTVPGRAWRDLDVEELSDDELEGYSHALEYFAPVLNSLPCPCGRTHVWNEGARRWDSTGTPTISRNRMPTSIAEFLAAGGGTPEEKEMHEYAQNEFRGRKAQILEQLVDNLDETEREAAWNEYKDLSLNTLEKMLSRFGGSRGGMAAGANGQPTTNMYGAQGPPPPQSSSIAVNVLPLAPPAADFSHRKTDRKTG